MPKETLYVVQMAERIDYGFFWGGRVDMLDNRDKHFDFLSSINKCCFMFVATPPYTSNLCYDEEYKPYYDKTPKYLVI
jgi:hypothetical protein